MRRGDGEGEQLCVVVVTGENGEEGEMIERLRERSERPRERDVKAGER